MSVFDVQTPSDHTYRTDGTGRAEVLAGSATYAELFVDSRNQQRIRIVGILTNHHYGSSRTMAGTVAAGDFPSLHHAEGTVNRSQSNMDAAFLLHAVWHDGLGRAKFGTVVTFRTAPAVTVIHFRLHQMLQQ